jgi:hypothetical protein
MLSGIFMFIAFFLTALLVYRHLEAPCEPSLSRHLFYILWMIPFYAINSWLTVLFPDQCLYFDVLKDGYEAFVLYRFYLLLIYYFNRDAPDYFTLRGTYNQSDIPPQIITEDMVSTHTREYFTYCEPYLPRLLCLGYACPMRNNRTGEVHCRSFVIFQASLEPTESLYYWIKQLILQYLIMRLILPFLIIPLNLLNLYHHRELSLYYASLWLSLLNNISMSLAIGSVYILICFIRPVIRLRDPMFKFLSLKLLILFIFWQSSLFSILSHIGVTTPKLFANYWSETAITEVLHNTLVCFELMWLSVYHIWIFPVPREIETTTTNNICFTEE